jgi:Domain of unknown function (DUF4382)
MLRGETPAAHCPLGYTLELKIGLIRIKINPHFVGESEEGTVMAIWRGLFFLRPAMVGIAAIALGTLGACGGGAGSASRGTPPAGMTAGPVAATGTGTPAGSGPTAATGTTTGSALTTGAVAMLLTDAPPTTAALCQIFATIERIDLLGGGAPTTVFTGPVTVNLLGMRSYSDLFAIDATVPAGTYNKIRLTLSDLAVVECDPTTGAPKAASAWEHPKLPGNGKLDLNPRGSFEVVGGETLIVQLDLDMGKSLYVHQTGNGKWQFRPVIFVNITPDNSKLVRVFGQVRALNGATFELCPLMPVPTLLSSPTGAGSATGGNAFGECLDVFTDASTAVFDENGSPVGLGGVANGDLLTAMGFLGPYDAEGDGRLDDLRLDAVVIKLGQLNTFQRIAGTVVSAPGHNDIFVFAPLTPTPSSTGSNSIDVLLQSGTRILAVGSSSELTSAALQPGTAGEVDGVFADPVTAGQPLKSSLIVLDKDATPTRVLIGAVIDTPPDVKSGRLSVIGIDKTEHCVLTSMTAPATLYLRVSESPTSTDIKVIAFGDLLEGDVVDVYGHDDPGGSSCIAADTIQDYGPTAAPK